MFKTTCLLFLVPAAAFGNFGEIVTSFQSPAGYPISLAYGAGDRQLWVFCNEPPYNLYRIHASTGEVYATIPSPWGEYTRGLAYAAGGYLYIGDYGTDYIYLVHSSNVASVLSSFPAGHNMYGGLALKTTGDRGTGGNTLWSTAFPQIFDMTGNGGRGSPAGNLDLGVYLHNRTTGSIVSSFRPRVGIFDAAWDWRNKILWGAHGPLAGFTEAGSLLGSYRYKRGFSIRGLVGVCYDGEYLWVGSTRPVAEILKIHCPKGIGVEPASLGRVKALLR